MKDIQPGTFWEGGTQPMPFNALTKIEGPFERHIEQLWDEVKKLNERINELEKNK